MTNRNVASQLLRLLPSIDTLLRTGRARSLREQIGAGRLTELARTVVDEMRAELQLQLEQQRWTNGDFSRDALLSEALHRLERAIENKSASTLRRVINASGVILHTNLGRAPLSAAARQAITNEAARYCTLEYDLETASRGRRGASVEKLLVELTGAEAAVVVNNCAAATLLVLSSLARDGEAIISRGEMVEIGGDFRVPDVMVQSGTKMIEVGTTNRTRLSDYEHAITERTRIIVRVHPSNYRIVGFTSTPTLAELASVAHEKGLFLFEDAGSGALLNLRAFGLEGEPIIGESIASGADLVAFSGDKLLGSVQAGLIVGRRELVERLRKNPLYRALRPHKLTFAALEATLDSYRREAALKEVPALRMIVQTRDEIKKRTINFIENLRSHLNTDSLLLELIEGESTIGGGAAPTSHLPTTLIALKHKQLSANALEEALRRQRPPIIARIENENVVLDLRTVLEDEESAIADALRFISEM